MVVALPDLKGSNLPLRKMARERVEVEPTPESLPPQGSVAAVRNKTGCADFMSFKNWPVHFVEYVKGRKSAARLLLNYYDYRAHLSLDVPEILLEEILLSIRSPLVHRERSNLQMLFRLRSLKMPSTAPSVILSKPLLTRHGMHLMYFPSYESLVFFYSTGKILRLRLGGVGYG